MVLGLFSERPVNLKTTGNRVSPRALLSTLLDKKLAMHQGDKDMTLLRVDVQGRKRKGDKSTRIHQYEMIDKFDVTTQSTSMARTTAHPCSTVALMLLEGKITERGFIPPELAIKDDRFDEFISRLERKGLNIKEQSSSPTDLLEMNDSLLPAKSFDTSWKPGESLTVVRELSLGDKREKIPTTFVPMAPEKLVLRGKYRRVGGRVPYNVGRHASSQDLSSRIGGPRVA